MGEVRKSQNFSSHISQCVIEADKELKKGDGGTLEQLKTYCSLNKADLFTARIAEEVTSFADLFKTLRELDIVNPADVSFVEEALRSVDRVDLSKSFQRAARQADEERLIRPPAENPPNGQPRANRVPIAPAPMMPPTEETVGEDLSGCFDVCIEYVGRDWRFLGRKLAMSEFELDEISEKHQRNLREQVSTLLYDWKRKNSNRATKAILVEALRRCKMALAADLVESTQTR